MDAHAYELGALGLWAGGRGGSRCYLPVNVLEVVKVLEEIAYDLGKNTSEKTFLCCLRDFQNSLVTLTFDKFWCG